MRCKATFNVPRTNATRNMPPIANEHGTTVVLRIQETRNATWVSTQKTGKERARKGHISEERKMQSRKLQEQGSSPLATHEDACQQLEKHELVYEGSTISCERIAFCSWTTTVHDTTLRIDRLLTTKKGLPRNLPHVMTLLPAKRFAQQTKEFRYTSTDPPIGHSAEKRSVTTGYIYRLPH